MIVRRNNRENKKIMNKKKLEYFRFIVIIFSFILLETSNSNIINIVMILLNILIFTITITILKISIVDEHRYFPIRFFWGAIFISLIAIIIYLHRILYFDSW